MIRIAIEDPDQPEIRAMLAAGFTAFAPFGGHAPGPLSIVLEKRIG